MKHVDCAQNRAHKMLFEDHQEQVMSFFLIVHHVYVSNTNPQSDHRPFFILQLEVTTELLSRKLEVSAKEMNNGTSPIR